MIGRRISHYRILENLGAGGMGVVYKAEDTTLRRTVALKFLPTELNRDAEAQKRFMLEAQAASALDHPNICTIHEIDRTSDGQMFIAMACYDGETLKHRIDREPMEVHEVVDVVRQVAQGLAKAHEHGIIHRDVNPSNVMITDEGVVKILDFGLAKLAGQTAITRPGSTAGTLAYMSPEQIKGDQVDHRTDIWSVGVVLFLMLTRSLPFRGEHAPAMMYSIVNEEPQDLSGVRTDIPEHLLTLCGRCLQKDPSRRPQSMREVLQLLNGSESRTPSGAIAAGRRRISRWLIAVPVAAAVLVIMVLLMRPRDTPPPMAQSQILNMGILKFENLTKDSGISSWPATIQTLLVTYLTGVEGLAVFEPITLNGLIEGEPPELERSAQLFDLLKTSKIEYSVDGSILKSRDQYVLYIKMMHATDRQVMFSVPVTIGSETELPQAMDTLAQQIIENLEGASKLSNKDQHLKAWWPRRFSSMAALKTFSRACQYAYEGEPAASEEYLRHAVELDSSFITPRVWLIARLVERGGMLEAEDHFQHLRDREANGSPFEQAVIGWAGACVSRDLQAQAHFLSLALDYSPGNNILLFNLGRVRYLMRDFHGCIQALLPAMEMKWHYPPMYFLLGECYDWIEQYKEAREVLEQSLSMKNVYPETYNLLTTIYLRTGDTTKAREYENLYVHAMRERGASLNVIYSALATMSFTEGLYEYGSRYHHLSLMGREDSPERHLRSADTLAQKGDTSAAIGEYYRALVSDPECIEAHFRLGEFFEYRGEKTRAISHYRAYIARDSMSTRAAQVQDHIAQLLR